jgi:hypothetical protein
VPQPVVDSVAESLVESAMGSKWKKK